MGCIFGVGGGIAEEERDHDEGSWDRLGGRELEQPLRDNLVKCVDSRYLVNLFRTRGRIERMQDLPGAAFIGLEDLKKLGTCRKTMFEPTPTIYEWLPVAILSYSWLGRGHPDPHAETLGVLAKALQMMGPYGVIIDFTSLPQVPRTEEENIRFKEGLQKLNVFYAHPHTLVLQVTDFPEGYPSARTYDLPKGHIPAEYPQRGWCFAEACISSLGKSPKFLCNLSRLPKDPRGVVGDCTNERVLPPLSPSAFNKELSEKAFTQKKTDLERVQKLYEDAFKSRIHDAPELMFAGVRWGPEQIRCFAQVVEVNQSVRHLDLSDNQVGVEGMTSLSPFIERHPALRSLKLVCCKLGDPEAGVLGEALKVNTSLTSLDLMCNQIGKEGARSLVEGLKVNSALTELDCTSNEIGDEGARFLAEGLKVNSTLTALHLDHNQIGEGGALALADALKVNNTLKRLILHNNQIANEGARVLAEAVRVNQNSGLTELHLSNSGVGAEGAQSLAEALRVNSTLTKLVLFDNNIGDEAARSLAGAARPGCYVHGI